MLEAKEFLRRGAGNNMASFEQDDAGREEKSFAKVVSDEDDRFAKTVDQGAEFALKLRARDGVERSEGFVHQENGWIGCKSTGNSYALALASREFARVAMREFARIEADKVKHFLNSHGDARGVPAFETGDETDIFRNGEMGKQAGLLNHVTDAASQADGIPGSGRTILDQDFSFRGKQHTVYQFKERGLAAAAAPEEHERLAMRNL